MIYLNYLKHLSAQGDFITYKHVSLQFHTAHLTVNTQYYEISSHVAATAFEVMWKYKYCRGILRCNSDPPIIKFNLYRTLILHVLPASVHHTDTKAFKGYYKFKTPPSWTVVGF
jgi:hypothetical protein